MKLGFSLLLLGTSALAAPFGLEDRPPLDGLTFPANVPLSARYEIVPAFPNLEFERALYIASPPGDATRLYVLEQGGRILTFPNSPAASSAVEFLDVGPLLSSAFGEEGLLGLAFDPDYATNGYFYLNYTAPNPRRTVIARYRRFTPDKADPASAKILLEVRQPYSNHNGGGLAFGPDGYLYIGMGDGGSAGDPEGHGQNRNSLLGKMLRIDPHGGDPYGIPADNPFKGQAGTRPEIYALGLRNPWRFSFDRLTQELWAGDVGQNRYEEIDIVAKGDNLGWNECEGRHRYGAAGACPAQYKAPIHEYPRSLGGSITGGYVYRGTRLPGLKGQYLYGDYTSRRVWALVKQGNKMIAHSDLGMLPEFLSSFGEDANGEVYLVGHGEPGYIYRLEERSGSTQPFPDRLSATGLFRDTARLDPNPGLIPYDVNVPLWSDGAKKQRWLGLPNGTQVHFHPTRKWEFPLGTALVKHFELNGRRLETRVLLRQREGWQGYTYRWNAAQTDAELVGEAGATETIGSQKWAYPSRADCLKCHTPTTGFALGLTTAQINRDFPYPAMTDNQLRAWNHIGLFSSDLSGQSHDALPGSSAALAERARAYLDVNCASCHRPAGGTPTDIDLRYGTTLDQTRLVNVAPQEGDLGIPGALRLVPGSRHKSLLWERMRRLDDKRMPNVGTHLVDADALALIGDWIDSL